MGSAADGDSTRPREEAACGPGLRARPRVVLDGRYIQDRFPGIGRLTHALVAALGRMDLDLDVVVPVPARGGGRLDLRPLAAGSVVLVPVGADPFSPREQVEMPLLARRVGADLWHAPHPVGPLFLPCPRVVHFHDAIPLREPGSVRSAWRRPAVRWLLGRSVRSARLVVTGSSSAREDAIGLLGAPAARTVVVSEGVDSRFRRPPDLAVAEVRARHGLGEEYVLHLSSGKPHKNVPRLIEAWGLAAPERGRAVLALAGDAGAQAPGAAPPGVRLLGRVDEADLPALYAGARLFVFPSLFEGFGLPVLEAMACGTPVVCSDLSSLPEVAGDAALLVNPRDPRAIAAAVVRLLRDGPLCEELRGRGLARATGFGWERTARACVEAWRGVLGMPPLPGLSLAGASE